MSHQLICAWLGLPPDGWPPDHYTLLGLTPGEASRERIEQAVHERMELLRRYQLAHPEPATEAMNRLAQAFDTLTNPVQKRDYDAGLFARPGAEPAAPEREAEPAPGGSAADPLAWLFGPWNPAAAPDWATAPPPMRPRAAEPPAPETPSAGGTDGPAPAAPAQSAEAPPEGPAAQPTPPRRGLSTQRALFRRIVWTRQLLAAWDQAGKYLNDPKRTLTRRAERADLRRQLTFLRELLRDFPLPLGQAGHPGYHVVTLARQPMVEQIFQGYLPSQRDKLAEDWQGGRALLLEYRDFLRRDLRDLRRTSGLRQLGRAARAALERPELWLVLGGLVALTIGYRNELADYWYAGLLAAAAVLGLAVLAEFFLHPVRRRRPPPPAPPATPARKSTRRSRPAPPG